MASGPCWAHGLAEKRQVGQCEERGSHVGVGIIIIKRIVDSKVSSEVSPCK